MKPFSTSAAASALMAITLSVSGLRAADAPASADDQWKKIEGIVHSMESPDPAPKSRDEAIKMLTERLKDFDVASDAFLKDYPKDARRWRIKLWDAETAAIRQATGQPSKGELQTVAEEILKAPDADAKTKAEASGYGVLLAYQDIDDGKITPDAWQKKAEEHLKAYPLFEGNHQIKTMLAQSQALAELKTKPLDLKFTAVDGKEVDLSKLRGKVVLLDFWATWCGPCVAEVPHVVEAYQKLHSKGFEIVGISLDQDKDKLLAFTKEHDMTWPQSFEGKGWQGEIPGRFGIRAIPAMWLLNKKGMLVKTDARGHLEEAVEQLLGE